ncbi:pinkman isoform 1-T2 [Cochliomyia hominivorax]
MNVEDDTSNEITPFVIKILGNFLDTKYEHQKYKYKIEGAAKKGDNYMGVVYRVTVIPVTKNKTEESLILKVPPQNPLQRNQFFVRAGFLREALAYEEFLPMICEFQNTKGLADKDNFFEYPKCYFTSIEDLNEAICMSDLQVEGFFMHNRFEPLTLDHVTFIMKVYGKLHATSLVLKDQAPNKFNSFKKISDIFEQRKDDIQLNDYLESLKQNALNSIDKKNEQMYWNRLNEYFKSDTFYNLMLSLLDAKSSEPYAVICHGDCWINNVMFKYKNSKVVDARLIDWQIMRYSSPIIDLLYFIMSSTTREFRQQHFQETLDLYHSAAVEHIKKLGSDPDIVFPRAAFNEEFKKKGAIGLIFSMIVLPILTTKSEDIPDLEKLSEKVSAGHSTDAMKAGFIGTKSTLFNERLRGVIMDTIDWNLI